jgi:hypothetical protein
MSCNGSCVYFISSRGISEVVEPAASAPILTRVIGGDHASGARHVFNQDRGRAGNMFAQVTGDRPGVGIETATGGEPDNDADSLALEKRFLRYSG